MQKLRYIALEGPIGVGKTSLAQLLADRFQARCIFEKANENPFLPRFYQDQKKYAFSTQLFFLLSRYEQQVDLKQHDLFLQMTISDYLFSKDRIFAYMNLDEDEIVLYERVYQLLQERIVKPDLTIYLHADVDILKRRIRRRNRNYERDMTEDYLQTVCEAYSDFFFYYVDTPLLVVDTSEIDFVRNPEDLDQLVDEIKLMRPGVWHYIPLGSR